MPGPRLPMRKIRDVPRLSAAGMSKRKIAASLGMSATGAVATLLIYLGNKLRYVDSALTRYFFQRVPKFVFEAHARLVAVENDRALGD